MQLLLIVAGVSNPTLAVAATLLVDDFSSGNFTLEFGGDTSNSASHTTSLTDQRTVSGIGDPNWIITLASGALSYSFDRLNPNRDRNFLDIDYFTSSGTFSILGYDAFALDLSGVSGSGELIVSVDGSMGLDIPVPFNGSGIVVFPFTNLGTSQPLDSLTLMQFRLHATSEDFSATIDNVRLIPEPSAALLSILGVVTAALRRRRKK